MPHTPWDPDRRWADPLLALLALLACLVASLALQARTRQAARPATQVGVQGRLLEVALATPGLLLGRAPEPQAWHQAEARLQEPWDRALLAVLKAEALPRGAAAPGPAEGTPASFQPIYLAAYAGGPMPAPADRLAVQRQLGRGYAAGLLEGRLLDREGGGEPRRAQARATLLTRLAWLSALGTTALLLALGGLVMGFRLWATRRQPPLRPLPAWEMSGRAAALVFLGWFLAFFVAGSVAAWLLRPWPALRWAMLPLGTLLHAACGATLIAQAEGLSLRALARRVAPGGVARALLPAAAFLALAVSAVLGAALLAGLVVAPQQSPQRELQELLMGLPGWGAQLLVFLTLAGLAPLFEELLFRGFLLPILARRGFGVALVGSSLLFGAIHLQPAGLPVLATLGVVLGLAVGRTGSLWVPILVHACWNGGQFLLLRALS